MDYHGMVAPIDSHDRVAYRAALRRLVILCAVLPLLWAHASARAATVPCGDRPIRVEFFEYGLYYMQGQGIDKDLVDALRQRSGCRIDAVVEARARTWNDLRTGRLDMATSALETPERDESAWFEPYLWIKNMTVLPRNVAQSVKSPADFVAQKTLTMGVVRGFAHGETQDRWIDRLRAENRVVEFVDVDQLFRNLVAHRVDAAIADALVYRKLLPPAELDQMTIEDWAPEDSPDHVCIVLSKARFNPAAAEQWRGLIREMVRDGTVAGILRRYLPETEVERILKH